MAGLTFGTWFMVMAPKGTPGPIIDRLNTLVNEVLADAEAKQRLEAAGLVLLGGTRARAAEFLGVEIRRHAEIVRISGARVD
jgi:tripartite-type tricarboxylate transporter receptor subunit TctC